MKYILFSLLLLAGCATKVTHEVTDDKGKNFIGAVVEKAVAPGTKEKAIRLGFLIPGASAYRMGLKPGDYITEVNGKSVGEFDEP